MQRFSELVIRLRTPIIIAVVLITALSLYFLKDLRVNNDMLSFLPQDDPAVILFNEVSEKFKGTSLAIIALKADEVFNYRTLRRIRDLTAKFEGLDGITQVMSLTNIIDLRKIEGGIEIGRIIGEDKIPQTKETLKRLREYTLDKEMYTGSLVSSDGTVTTIVCRIREGVDQFKVGTELRKMTDDFYRQEGKDREEVYYAGMPFQMVLINDMIAKDNQILIPLVILLVMLTLYLSFRSGRGVFLPLITVIISTLWSLGLMSFLGASFTMASILIPVLLIAVGSAYGIHMINRYNEEVRDAPDKIKGLTRAMSKVGLPIILAGVTTMIGFLSFLSSDMSLIREAGMFTAIGIFFALIFSLVFLPAVLSTLKVTKKVVDAQEGGEVSRTKLSRVLERLGNFVIENKRGILISALIIAIAFLSGLPRLNREVNWEEYVKEGCELRVTEQMMREKFGGSIPVQIHIKGDIKNPFVLKEMIKVEKFLRSLPHVHHPHSIADLIGETNDMMNDRSAIPDTREGVGNLWFFLEGNEILDLLVNKKMDEAVIQATMGTMDTAKMVEIVNKINGFLKSKVKTKLVEINITEAESKLKQVLVERRVENILSRIGLDIKGRCPECQFDENPPLTPLFQRAIPPNPPLKKGGIRGDLVALSNRKEVVENAYSTRGLWAIISRSLSQGKPVFDEDLLERIRTRMEGYFEGDECDIEIDSMERVERIVAEITQRLKGGGLSEEEIRNILRENLTEETIAKDPEAMGYAAESLYAIIEQEREEYRVLKLMAEVKAMLPLNLSSDRDFLRDLKADLWEMNETHTALDYQSYLNLIGSDPGKDLHPQRLSLQQTGLPPIFLQIYYQLVRSLLLSLFFALALVLLILIVQLRSLVGGLISIVPIVLTVIICFGLMGYLGIALDDMTVMTASIAIGIGIDYAIHFTSRFRSELREEKRESEALIVTLKTTGRAIVINAITVMMGFIVLVRASMVPIQRFGWLIALLMFISALGALTLLPALILTTKPRFVRILGSSRNRVGRQNSPTELS